jgi:hypothetical protein
MPECAVLIWKFEEWRAGCVVSVSSKLRSGEFMDAKLDIFKRLPDGQPLWVKAVDGLEEAKAQLAQLAASAPGDYFIYSVKLGRVLQTELAASA